MSELGCAEQSVAQYRGSGHTLEVSFDTSHLCVETANARCLGLPTTLSAAQTAVYSVRLERPGQEDRLCVHQWRIQGEAGDGHGPLSPPLVLIKNR